MLSVPLVLAVTVGEVPEGALSLWERIASLWSPQPEVVRFGLQTLVGPRADVKLSTYIRVDGDGVMAAEPGSGFRPISLEAIAQQQPGPDAVAAEVAHAMLKGAVRWQAVIMPDSPFIAPEAGVRGWLEAVPDEPGIATGHRAFVYMVQGSPRCVWLEDPAGNVARAAVLFWEEDGERSDTDWMAGNPLPTWGVQPRVARNCLRG